MSTYFAELLQKLAKLGQKVEYFVMIWEKKAKLGKKMEKFVIILKKANFQQNIEVY